MLMWGVTVVEKQPKSWLHQEEPAAADNKVIITQALQRLTAGAGEMEHLGRCSHVALQTCSTLT